MSGSFGARADAGGEGRRILLRGSLCEVSLGGVYMDEGLSGR